MVDVVGGSQPSPRGCRGEQTRVAQGAETGWWVRWVSASFVLGGSGASSSPPMVVENCLSRNLKLWEGEGGALV